MKGLFMFVLIITSGILISVIGDMDYQDAQNEEAYYREMVCSGAWPDYRAEGVECVK